MDIGLNKIKKMYREFINNYLMMVYQVANKT